MLVPSSLKYTPLNFVVEVALSVIEQRYHPLPKSSILESSTPAPAVPKSVPFSKSKYLPPFKLYYYTF